MPLLYNRSMMESASMNDILDDVYSEFFAAHVGSKVALLKPDQIDKAFTAAMEKVAAYDFGEVAPGYYDLGGFVMDELFGMKYPSREFAAKVHRIT